MQNQVKERVIKQSSAVYGLGVIGSMIYFIQHASGFWMGVLGILKSFVWPAFFVYRFFEYINM